MILKLDDRKQQAAVAATLAETERARAYLNEMVNGARMEDIAAARASVGQIEARLVDADKRFQRNEVEKSSTLSGMTNSLQRIFSILMKEFRQLSRDHATFAMIVIIPLVELLLFGYAINIDVREIPVSIVDQSQTYFSRALVDAVKTTIRRQHGSWFGGRYSDHDDDYVHFCRIGTGKG